uniref:exodeoxyribonuclease III n=1 Tax=Oryzias latipes TaxID=8090 RepID=A0A3P9LA77_ORYLA
QRTGTLSRLMLMLKIIASLNVNGLTTPKKRGIILQKLRKENIQLALLQETHLNDQEHEKLKKLGFRNTYYSSYKQGRKRGVAILFSNKTNFETDKVIKGKDGQYIIVKGRMGDAVLTIVNVYAPPESDKQFFKSLLVSAVSSSILLGRDLTFPIITDGTHGLYRLFFSRRFTPALQPCLLLRSSTGISGRCPGSTFVVHSAIS